MIVSYKNNTTGIFGWFQTGAIKFVSQFFCSQNFEMKS